MSTTANVRIEFVQLDPSIPGGVIGVPISTITLGATANNVLASSNVPSPTFSALRVVARVTADSPAFVAFGASPLANGSSAYLVTKYTPLLIVCDTPGDNIAVSTANTWAAT